VPRNKAELLNEILKTKKSLTQCMLKEHKLKDTLRKLGKELGVGTFVHVHNKETYVLKVDWQYGISIQKAESVVMPEPNPLYKENKNA
jgi:hypothetical protein